MKPKPIKINAPIMFRKFLYEEKAKNPEKSLLEIMEEIAMERKRRRKNDSFLPKL